jgi:putative FmdB family regulatory protein
MPTYDYDCRACGPFEAFRRMAERDRATACPRCGSAAARVLAGGAHLRVVDGATRRVIEAHERAAADGAYRRMRHPLGCGCCAR